MNPDRMAPQCRQILRLLETNREGITQQDAIREAACYRLAARISDLRSAGFVIDSELRTVRGRTFAVYTLDEGDIQAELGL